MGNVAFITGAASGIGRALAHALLQRGYKLYATDINLEGLQALATNWPQADLVCEDMDVRDEEAWEEHLEEARARWGRIDLLFNVAGYLKPGYGHETELTEVHKHIDINAKGAMTGSILAARIMVGQQSGHIINICSLAALVPVPGLNLYSASKYALRSFSLSLAESLAKEGVSVTAVCPDAVQTPMLDLQVDYEEAALTFSGQKPLTTDQVVSAIFKKVIPKRPVEISIPASRGLTAKLVNFFPGLIRRMHQDMFDKGLRTQARLKRSSRRP